MRSNAIQTDLVSEELEFSYEEWVATAKSSLREIRTAGVSAEAVRVDIDELVSWCEEQGLALDGQARAHYAAEKLRQRHEGS